MVLLMIRTEIEVTSGFAVGYLLVTVYCSVIFFNASSRSITKPSES